MAQDLTTILAYYQDLLIYQYALGAKNRANIELLVRQAICDLVVFDVRDAFDIETAIGVQLDMLGEFLGFSRIISAQIERPYWRLQDYDAYVPSVPFVGLTDYTDNTVNANSVFYKYSYATQSFTTLSDEEYRKMLKLKIVLNSSGNTLYSVTVLLWDAFGLDIRLYDLADMTLSYAVKTGATGYSTLLAITQNLLPKPMGVKISGVFQYPDVDLVFGLQDYAYDNGNAPGLADYGTGFNGLHWLNYADKIA